LEQIRGAITRDRLVAAQPEIRTVTYAHVDPRCAGNLDNYTFMAFHVRTYWSPLKMFKTLPS